MNLAKLVKPYRIDRAKSFRLKNVDPKDTRGLEIDAREAKAWDEWLEKVEPEWLDREEKAWQARLAEQLLVNFTVVREFAAARGISYRTAAYAVAIERVVRVSHLRGIYA